MKTPGMETMHDLEAAVRQCRLCGLCERRTQAVPGEGDANAVIMFIGEGPGADEDAQGRPFVGRSGQLLTRMLQQVGINRQEVYITNVVKCRPPGNRDPMPQEMAACAPYLERQIEIVNPRIIVTLGRFSMQRWFPGERITRIHGRIRNIGLGRCAIPLFHPAAVLRDARKMADYERLFARLPVLIQRAREADAKADQGLGLPAGVPHPGDPDFSETKARDPEPAHRQESLFGE